MKRFTTVFLLIFLVSCTSNTVYKKPKNLIPKDTMVALITDMMLASSSKHIKNKGLQKKINYMPWVYDVYKIDSARFKSSNFYYLTKVDEYEAMLDTVKNRITFLKEKYTKLKNTRDSIRKDSLSKLEDKSLFKSKVKRPVEIMNLKKSQKIDSLKPKRIILPEDKRKPSKRIVNGKVISDS